jgi:hypothetical protein
MEDSGDPVKVSVKDFNLWSEEDQNQIKVSELFFTAENLFVTGKERDSELHVVTSTEFVTRKELENDPIKVSTARYGRSTKGWDLGALSEPLRQHRF